MSVLSCYWFCKALNCEWTVNQLTAALRPSDGRIHGDTPKMATQINPFVWNSQWESTFIFQRLLLGSGVVMWNTEQKQNSDGLATGSSPRKRWGFFSFLSARDDREQLGIWYCHHNVLLIKVILIYCSHVSSFFTFSQQCHLIRPENKYNDLHSGTKLKSNLWSLCFIANSIRVTYRMRDVSNIRFVIVSLLSSMNRWG